MKTRKIIQSYTKQYLDPIQLNIGDQVVLEKEETEYKTNSGWIPIQIIQFSSDNKTGLIIKNYSAQELSVAVNDWVEILEFLNGWCWVKNIASNEEGWIPSECIENLN